MWNGTNFGRAAPVAALFAFAAAGSVVEASFRVGQALAEQPAAGAGVGPVATQEERLELQTATGVHVLSIEVARTSAQQQTGLMFRTKLAEDKGMLFPHAPPREVQMWMRNTYIPLDMVFIRADGVVHRIEAQTEPFSERIISSNGPVAGVLEIAGGLAAKLGLKAGDVVRHSHFKAK